jgi:hypothetical protein
MTWALDGLARVQRVAPNNVRVPFSLALLSLDWLRRCAMPAGQFQGEINPEDGAEIATVEVNANIARRNRRPM